MPIGEADELVKIVEEDVTAVFGTRLPGDADGEGFRLAEPAPFTRRRAIIDDERAVAAVVWEWVGHDRGVPTLTPHGERQVGLLGFDATGRVITVRGVTLVSEHETERIHLHRYVDWLDVLAQSGISVNPRPIVDAATAFGPAIGEIEHLQGLIR